jgi:hypothetical protein
MVVLRRAMLGAGAHRDPVLPSYRGTTTRKRSSSAPGPLPHLSNRVFETYDAIVEAACEAWRNLLAEPSTITSIGHRDWAHVGQK